MSDDQVRPWFTDDPLVLNAALVVAATSLAVALTTCLWHHVRPDPHRLLPDDPPSVISAALASLHFSVARPAPPTTQQQSPAVPAQEPDQKDRKGTRSKERRRRGKDPLRDLFKGGKKSKALLPKAAKATDHSMLSADALTNSSVPQNDTASSTSRSQSPEPAADNSGMDRLATHLGVDSDDGSARSVTPNGNTSSPITSTADPSERGSSSDAGSQTGGILADVEADISSASTVLPHASEDASSSPTASTAPAEVRTPPSRDSQAEYISESCAKLVRARTRLRLLRMDPSAKSSLLSSSPPPLLDSVATSSSVPIAPCPSLLITPSTSRSTDGGAAPSTPTNSRGPTPPPRSPSTLEEPGSRDLHTQPLDECAASAHMQLAAMHSALEASRLREEQLRLEAEQASKERDELRWGWNEDVSVWRRRESELHAQIHHLMQQLQAYAAVASFQAQHAVSSPFASPTSPHPHSPRLQHHHPLAPFPPPPPVQPQNSASPPAHVQALLCRPPGFAPPSGGFYSGPGFGMSPLLWSGMGLYVPNRDARHGGRHTPDSSASGSSSRGRRGRQRADDARSASDESSLGEWDGMEDGSEEEDAWEEEEDVFSNNVLADAILKRPESIRGLGKASRRRPPFVQGGVGERMDALKDPALEKAGFVPPPVAAGP